MVYHLSREIVISSNLIVTARALLDELPVL